MKDEVEIKGLFYVDNKRRKLFAVYEQLGNKVGRKLFDVKYRTANSNVPYELSKEEAENKVKDICYLISKRYLK